jgi:hypothetical protein
MQMKNGHVPMLQRSQEILGPDWLKAKTVKPKFLDI